MSMYNVVPIIPSEVKPSTADLSKNVCVFHPESVLSSNATKGRRQRHQASIFIDGNVLKTSEGEQTVPANTRKNSRLSKSAKLQAETEKQTFEYDHVFAPGAQRSDFFATVGAPCVAAVVEAQKSSVFVTLGGTGTGKSHTLFGDLSADLSGSSDGGVASQALSHLFREVLRGEGEAVFGKKEGGGEGKGGWGGDYGTNNNNSSNPGCALSHFGTASSTSLGRGVGVGESVGECPFLVEMVFLEVLGGSVIDLLKAPEARRQLAVVKDRFGLFSVNGLSRTQVSSETEALSLLRCSLSQRSVESLPTNSRTSRGHSMLSVVVTKRATGQRAALSFVDVATAMALSSAGAPSDPVSQAISDSLQALRLIISQIVHFPVLPELDELDEECRNSVFSSLAYWKSRGVWSPLGEEISYEDSVLSKLLKPIFSCPNTMNIVPILNLKLRSGDDKEVRESILWCKFFKGFLRALSCATHRASVEEAVRCEYNSTLATQLESLERENQKGETGEKEKANQPNDSMSVSNATSSSRSSSSSSALGALPASPGDPQGGRSLGTASTVSSRRRSVRYLQAQLMSPPDFYAFVPPQQLARVNSSNSPPCNEKDADTEGGDGSSSAPLTLSQQVAKHTPTPSATATACRLGVNFPAYLDSTSPSRNGLAVLDGFGPIAEESPLVSGASSPAPQVAFPLSSSRKRGGGGIINGGVGTPEKGLSGVMRGDVQGTPADAPSSSSSSADRAAPLDTKDSLSSSHEQTAGERTNKGNISQTGGQRARKQTVKKGTQKPKGGSGANARTQGGLLGPPGNLPRRREAKEAAKKAAAAAEAESPGGQDPFVPPQSLLQVLKKGGDRMQTLADGAIEGGKKPKEDVPPAAGKTLNANVRLRVEERRARWRAEQRQHNQTGAAARGCAQGKSKSPMKKEKEKEKEKEGPSGIKKEKERDTHGSQGKVSDVPCRIGGLRRADDKIQRKGKVSFRFSQMPVAASAGEGGAGGKTEPPQKKEKPIGGPPQNHPCGPAPRGGASMAKSRSRSFPSLSLDTNEGLPSQPPFAQLNSNPATPENASVRSSAPNAPGYQTGIPMRTTYDFTPARQHRETNIVHPQQPLNHTHTGIQMHPHGSVIGPVWKVSRPQQQMTNEIAPHTNQTPHKQPRFTFSTFSQNLTGRVETRSSPSTPNRATIPSALAQTPHTASQTPQGNVSSSAKRHQRERETTPPGRQGRLQATPARFSAVPSGNAPNKLSNRLQIHTRSASASRLLEENPPRPRPPLISRAVSPPFTFSRIDNTKQNHNRMESERNDTPTPIDMFKNRLLTPPREHVARSAGSRTPATAKRNTPTGRTQQHANPVNVSPLSGELPRCSQGLRALISPPNKANARKAANVRAARAEEQHRRRMAVAKGKGDTHASGTERERGTAVAPLVAQQQQTAPSRSESRNRGSRALTPVPAFLASALESLLRDRQEFARGPCAAGIPLNTDKRNKKTSLTSKPEGSDPLNRCIAQFEQKNRTPKAARQTSTHQTPCRQEDRGSGKGGKKENEKADPSSGQTHAPSSLPPTALIPPAFAFKSEAVNTNMNQPGPHGPLLSNANGPLVTVHFSPPHRGPRISFPHPHPPHPQPQTAMQMPPHAILPHSRSSLNLTTTPAVPPMSNALVKRLSPPGISQHPYQYQHKAQPQQQQQQTQTAKMGAGYAKPPSALPLKAAHATAALPPAWHTLLPSSAVPPQQQQQQNRQPQPMQHQHLLYPPHSLQAGGVGRPAVAGCMYR